MTLYADFRRVVGMQLISVAGDIGIGRRTVTLTFRPVGHQYGTTTVTLPLAGLNLADQPSHERST